MNDAPFRPLTDAEIAAAPVPPPEPDTFRKRLRRFRRLVAHALLAPVEVMLVRTAIAVIPRLSRRHALALARFAGGTAFRLSRRDNRHMAANLDLIYGPARDPDERRRFMRAVWNHTALVVVDCFWFLRDTHRRVTEWVEIDDTLKAISRGTEGCAAITAHLGNWELAAHAMCEDGRKLTSVFAPIGTPYTQKKLLASREVSGQHLVPKQGAVLNLLRCYRRRQIIGLLLDQYTKVTEGGLFVDILGVPAPISRIAGTIHARCGCPLYIAACIHVGGGRYRAQAFATLPSGSGLSEEKATRWVADKLSDMIRRYPDQWLWMYRRWRHVRPGDDPARYPFYAHSFNPLID